MIEILPNWHPILVHFTLALYVAAVVFLTVGHAGRQKSWAPGLVSAGTWNLFMAAAVTILTVAAGFYAYNTVAHDAPSHAAMTDHRNWGIASTLIVLGAGLWLAWTRRKQVAIGPLALAVLMVSLIPLGLTGWKGGELVYRYGLGVMSLPESDGGDGHDHDHGEKDELDGGDSLEPSLEHPQGGHDHEH